MMKKYATLAVAVLMAVHALSQEQFKTINPEQSLRELNILKAALTSLHPGIYRYESTGQVDSLFASLSQQLTMPVAEDRYFVLLSQALTHIRCGHTYTNYWNQPKEVSGKLFSKTCMPFLFRMIGNKMIVTHNLSESKLIKPGDEVLSINGIATVRVVDSLLTVSPSDGLHGLARRINNISIEPLDADTANYNLFDIYFPLFFSRNFNTKHYTVGFKRNDGKVLKLTLNAITKTDRLRLFSKRYGLLPVHENNWSLRFPDVHTACFRIGDFETWEWKKDYHKYLDSLFAVLRLRNINNLIIDIRGNRGGDDAARDEVFSYLTDIPFGCIDPMHKRVRFMSVPDTLMPFLRTWDKSFQNPRNPADHVLTEDSCYEKKNELADDCTAVMPKALHFTGKKFLVTDARNESTTFTLAKLFKTYKVGEIIGEPTSGNQQGINGGQFFFLYLPYSRIEIDIPLVWGAYTGRRSDTGIAPDKYMPVSRTSIAKSKDPAIDYILQEVKKKVSH